ncbi:hypothetical protein ACWT_5689 [Actinoplanes sp. SE50]|uniref:hypothetical protein n=1 Tax=unclassified Actinoplanes TaxID=2626549 RepID=UPI00023ED2D8|nr:MULTISPECIES: hypothetical protein [unclassified Actinoplanes]AEV86706.1 hypothetical protein ACPL_5819 [Actinoplanes sp. SE50/110]ATO85104.1 hypothetical protein ACWT_5689 [Actinoplanes sp. SE50]SLM02515.1 hypothetical protein ACSP50_5765 [Actinoplanes sp. SE50/110]
MTDQAQPIEHIEDIPPELRGLFLEHLKAARHVQEEEIKALHAKLREATRRGYDLALTTLKDESLYMQWWNSSHCSPDGPAREHYLRYLTDTAPGGVFWEVAR